jgi:type III pantothenate kinase
MKKGAYLSLAIDHGNTALKFAVFEASNPVKTGSGLKSLLDDAKAYNIQKSIISSVGNPSVLSDIEAELTHVHRLNVHSQLPIKNLYKSPKTLGNDRLANAVAAAHLSETEAALVVDVGTCLKFDFVNEKKQYLGGSISPGLRMRFKALEHFTAALPNFENTNNFDTYLDDFIGKNTEQSIVSGVYMGMLNEINATIERYAERNKDITIFLTGGDAKHFENAINYRIFAPSNLTLLGLKLILDVNE